MSNMIVSVAGPPAASTRTPVAWTLTGRPAVDGAGMEVAHRHAIADRQCFELLDPLERTLPRFARRVQVGHPDPAHRLRAGESEQTGRRRIGVEDDAVAVQENRRRRALEQLAITCLACRVGALGADLVGDVAGDAPIAVEHAFFGEARLAADAVHTGLSVEGSAAHDQAAERAVRFEVGPVQIELRFAHADVGQVPGRVAQALREHGRVDRAARIRNEGEAEVPVLLPVPVGDEAQRLARLLCQTLGHAQAPREHAHRQRARDQRRAGDESEQAKSTTFGATRVEHQADGGGCEQRAGDDDDRDRGPRSAARQGAPVRSLRHRPPQAKAALRAEASSRRAAWAARREAAAKSAPRASAG